MSASLQLPKSLIFDCNQHKKFKITDYHLVWCIILKQILTFQCRRLVQLVQRTIIIPAKYLHCGECI